MVFPIPLLFNIFDQIISLEKSRLFYVLKRFEPQIYSLGNCWITCIKF
jgi:hypothetical protein